MFAGGMHGLILPVRGSEEGFSLISLGLIGATWSVGFISGSILVPRLVRQVGHIRSYAVMAAMACAAILFNLLFIDEVAWIALRALSGFCFAGAAMIVESWLNEVSDNRSRGTMFSIYLSLTLFATTAGQLAITGTGVAGYVPFVIAALAYIGAILPTAITRTPQPPPLQAVTLDIGLLYRTSPVAVVAAFSVGMANGSFGTLAPVYGIERGFDTTTVALVFSLAIVSGAIAQVPLGRLSDRLDRRQVLMGVALTAALGGLLMMLFNPSPGPLLYILVACYGLGAYSLYAIAVAHANDFADAKSFARVASGMLVVMGAGLMLGPVISSLVMQQFGPVALFVVPVVFHGALAGTAFLRMRMRLPLPVDDRAPFQPIATDKLVTAETIVLDPRTEQSAEPFEDGEPPMEEDNQ